MRAIIKIQSNVPKAGFDSLITSNYNDSWDIPDDKIEIVENLIGRVYENHIDEIEKMKNYAFKHKTIDSCFLLISISNDNIDIRIFYDHIATLRELAGKFLKDFERFIIAPHKDKYTFDHNYPVIISEAHNNNILDEGIIALKTKDYYKKTIRDRKTEFFLFCIISFLTILTLILTIIFFSTPQKATLGYELVSKCIAPFFASSILTGMNLLVYYWHLKSNTNILWGHKYGY
jgi:hypothetical protein